VGDVGRDGLLNGLVLTNNFVVCIVFVGERIKNAEGILKIRVWKD
jgi:hypothetical protein